MANNVDRVDAAQADDDWHLVSTTQAGAMIGVKAPQTIVKRLGKPDAVVNGKGFYTKGHVRARIAKLIAATQAGTHVDEKRAADERLAQNRGPGRPKKNPSEQPLAE